MTKPTTRQDTKQRMLKNQKRSLDVGVQVEIIPVSQSTQTTSIEWNQAYTPYVTFLLKWIYEPRCSKGKMMRLLNVDLLVDRVKSVILAWNDASYEHPFAEINLLFELYQFHSTSHEVDMENQLGPIMANAFILVALMVNEELPEMIDTESIKTFGKEIENVYQVQWMTELVPSLMKL